MSGSFPSMPPPPGQIAAVASNATAPAPVTPAPVAAPTASVPPPAGPGAPAPFSTPAVVPVSPTAAPGGFVPLTPPPGMIPAPQPVNPLLVPNAAAEQGPPDLSLPTIPELGSNAEFTGIKGLIYGPTMGRKTSSLRNLGRNGERVLYMEANGNIRSIEKLIDAKNWTIRRPNTFKEYISDLVQYGPSHDIHVHDHGTQVQKMFTSQWLGQDTVGSAGIWAIFSGRVKRPAQNDYADISYSFGLMVYKSLEFAAKVMGGKSVIWFFLLGADQPPEKGGTGKAGPDAVGRLTRDIPTFFDFVFPIQLFNVQGAEGAQAQTRAYFQTASTGREFAGHRFNLPGPGGNPEPIFEAYEEADVAAILKKIKEKGF